MKNNYVSALSEGVRIDDVFLICNKTLAESRNGSLFIKLQLGDRTGTIEGYKWDASQTLFAQLGNADYVRVLGSVRNYNGKLQIDIESFRAHTHKVDPSDFLPSCPRDSAEMIAEIEKLVESVKHPHLRALLDCFFSNKEFLARFSTAPAAQKIHHAYIGGLLEHSLSAANLCDLVASKYPNIDRDLLITGALLHDIGKVEELSWDKSIKYSDSGHLVGHIVGGAMMVDKAADTIDGFHPLLKLKMTHMILSHHGQKDFGSPKRPKSLESLVLHYMEDLDAKINIFRQALAADEQENELDLWTERHWVFERPLFRGLPKWIMDPLGDGHSPDRSEDADYDPFAEE